MKRIITAIFATWIAGLVLAPAAMAREWDVWALEAYDDICQISFDGDTQMADGIARLVRHSEECRGGGNSIDGYSLNNDGNTILVYTVAGGLQVLGRFDREGDGSYVGMMDDGVPARLWFMGRMDMQSAAAPRQPGKPAAAAKGQQARTCTAYVDSGRCAETWDLGAPEFVGGRSSITTLARMDVRFLNNPTSRVIDSVEQGQCIDTTACREAPFKGGLWCEVRVGNFSGWVLKQDDQFVYARNGCG